MAVLLTLTKKYSINENDLSNNLADREAGAVQLSIAQIKEVQKHLLDILGEAYASNPRGVIELIKKHMRD